MKQFLYTVAAGVAVGVIVRKISQPQQQGGGNQIQDYTGQGFAAWTAQQRGG